MTFDLSSIIDKTVFLILIIHNFHFFEILKYHMNHLKEHYLESSLVAISFCVVLT